MVGGAPATWGSPRVLVIPVAAVPRWSGVWSWEGGGEREKGGEREREREREKQDTSSCLFMTCSHIYICFEKY